MSFDETRLPLRVGFGSSGGPQFSTEIITIDGGFERRNQNWAAARRRYDAATGLRTAADIATLTAFFHARAGRARGFRLKDWADFTSAPDNVGATTATDQTIGTGTGALTTFALSKTYTSGAVSHVRTITKPVAGTVKISINNVTQLTGWSVNTATGVITFGTPPANGAVIKAGFEFDVPVRFDTDTLAVSIENLGISTARVPLVEVRI